MYINHLYLPLFNFVYIFFLFFLSFLLNILVSFNFIALFPTWHLALVLLSSCALFSFVLVDIIFAFVCQVNLLYLIFVGLFLFWLWVYMCIYMYSVTISTVVINLCLDIGLLQFCGVFLPHLFFLLPLLLFSLFYNFNF